MASRPPQTFLEAIRRIAYLKLDTRLALTRAYDDWFLKQYFHDKHKKFKIEQTKLKVEDHLRMGSDLAVTNFVTEIARGKVRINNGDWIAKADRLTDINSTKLTHIDASNCSLITEAIDNFVGLVHLKHLDLSKNPKLDDFACDILGRQFRNSQQLEEIALNFNPFITIYGLEVLFRIPSLKRIMAVGTMAGKNDQAELFQVVAEVERNCEVILK